MNDEKMKDEKMLEKEKQAGRGDEGFASSSLPLFLLH